MARTPIMEDEDMLLTAYADGELDPVHAEEVECRLAVDSAARRTVEVHREMTALLCAACSENVYTGGTPVLPLRSAMRRPAPVWRGSRVAWAAVIAAAWIGAFGGGAIWGGWTPDSRAAVLNEVAEYHQVYSRETNHLVEIPAANRAELARWLAQRVGRAIDAPDLTEAGLTFAGGRMLVIDAKPVAELMYTRADGLPVALCVTAAAVQGANDVVRLDQRGELRLASWTNGGHVFVVVGEADAVAIRDLAERVIRATAG
jgi:anti-sigma factor RsiW